MSEIKGAALKGLKLVEEHYKEIDLNLPESSYADIHPSLIPKKKFEVLNPYLIRSLPPLIGSSEFSSWDPSSLKWNVEQNSTEYSEVVVKKEKAEARVPEM